ncbi:MAG TPA: serine protease, partial [Verrucomicrobiales bacterium]|nr:serine protease [Verrucomicrobiales bacterium]
VLITGACVVRGQAPGVPIEQPVAGTGVKEVIEKAGVLREAGKLASAEKVAEFLKKPAPEKVTLPSPKTEPMSRSAIYEEARRDRVRVGWYYLCKKCNHWHTRLAGGYPLTEDGVIATCHHVVQPGDDMREGYLIVVDGGGVVTPVTSVIADSTGRDICVIRAAGGKFKPMPLNDAVHPGDAAYCLSDPLGVTGYFSEGMVNRFYRKPDGKGTDEESLRLHVSTDWAPGSSGSPVLDQSGNVIGHVSTISAMSEAPAEGQPRKGGTQIVLHEASTARGVIALLKSAEKEAEAGKAPEAATAKPADPPAPKPAEPPPAKPAETPAAKTAEPPAKAG